MFKLNFENILIDILIYSGINEKNNDFYHEKFKQQIKKKLNMWFSICTIDYFGYLLIQKKLSQNKQGILIKYLALFCNIQFSNSIIIRILFI